MLFSINLPVGLDMLSACFRSENNAQSKGLFAQAEQLKQKEEALAEKSAYVGKLEWRLLCQHRALEERRGRAPPAVSAGKPPARKPQLAGAVQACC